MSRRRASVIALKYLSASHARAAQLARRLSTAAQRTDLPADPLVARNSDGVYGENHNVGGGFYGQNSQPNSNGNEWTDGGGFQQTPAGRHGGTAWNNQNALPNYSTNAGGFHQTPGGHHGVNTWHNPGRIYREDAYQHKPEINPNGSERSNYGGLDRNSRVIPIGVGSAGGFQQIPNGFQQNPSDFQQNTSDFQQNTSDFQQSSGFFPRGTGEPFPLSNTQAHYGQMPSSESPEPDETGGYKGTLEELDGFCKEGRMKDAVEVLALLEKQCVMVDLQRFLQLLQACGEARCLEEARVIHSHISRAMGNVEVWVSNKILDMYSKCGSMVDAYQLFERMPQRNLTSWETMITGLANNGHGEEAVELFTEFKKKGLTPDGGLFIAVFSACAVLGAVDEGMLHFEEMKTNFSISPSMEHYVSIVDMLGQSGYVDEALEFIEKMPIEPSVDVWETLMNLCRINGNVELGDRCAEIVEHLDPSRLTEQARNGLIPVKASDLEREKRRKKNSNLLEVTSRVHEYRAGDRSHPENDKIYEQIRGLTPQMKEAGYVPETRFVLHDVDQESKEEALLYHSERLAFAYAVMTSAARSPIRIIKNLRVCGDCHNAMKILSKLVGRQLIARDAKRFHHFENGVCSCKDYW